MVPALVVTYCCEGSPTGAEADVLTDPNDVI
jgi:hypothetical protein